jgi:hypothetical protein
MMNKTFGRSSAVPEMAKKGDKKMCDKKMAGVNLIRPSDLNRV